MDTARRHCMWTKSDSNGRSKPLVAWKKCTRPKIKGGLVVINLRRQTTALQLFYNQQDIPWVNLVWSTYYNNVEAPHAARRKALAKIMWPIQRGSSMYSRRWKTVLSWSNLWNGHILQNNFPRLYSYAKNKQVSVVHFFLNSSIEEQFHLTVNPGTSKIPQALQQVLQQI